MDLPKHLRTSHNVSSEDSRNYIQAHGMRGPFKKVSTNLRTCNYNGCTKKVKRLDLHLSRIHKVKVLKRTSVKFNARHLDEPKKQDRPSTKRIISQLESEASNKQDLVPLLLKLIDLYQTHLPISVNKRAVHAKRCITIIQMLRPTSVEDMLDEHKLINFFSDKFKNKTWQAVTVRHYILSLIKFYEYLAVKQNIAMTPQQCTKLNHITKEMRDWRNEYITDAKKEQYKLWQERKKLLHNKTDVQKYLKSANYLYYVSLLRFLKKEDLPPTLTCTQYYTILRNIITLFHLRSPKRASVLTKVKLEDYINKAKEDDEFVVNVRDHKTSGTYGDSCCPFNKEQCLTIDTYITKCRTQVENDTSEGFLFLKFNGKPLSNSSISHHLNQNWRISGIKSKTNSTVFRDSLVTEMYRSAPSVKEKENAALLMDHDINTGYKQYNIILKGEKAVTAAKYSSGLLIPAGGEVFTGDEEMLGENSDSAACDALEEFHIVDESSDSPAYEEIVDVAESCEQFDTAAEYSDSPACEDSDASASCLPPTTKPCVTPISKTPLTRKACTPPISTACGPLTRNSSVAPLKSSLPRTGIQKKIISNKTVGRSKVTVEESKFIREICAAMIQNECTINAKNLRSIERMKGLIKKHGMNYLLTRVRYERNQHNNS